MPLMVVMAIYALFAIALVSRGICHQKSSSLRLQSASYDDSHYWFVR
jgi:hypothetical protein